MKKILFSSILSLVIISLNISGVYAFNTFNDHVFVNGITGMRYFIDSTGYWRNPYTNAFNNWNATATRFSFSETTTMSASKTDCYTYGSATDNMNGYTTFFNNSSSVSPYNVNWFWTEIHLNTTALQNTSAAFDNGVAGHEIGHTVGLDHNNANTQVIMCDAANGRAVTTPQGDDINGVNHLYP